MTNYNNPNESNLFGILEGKRRARIEEEKRKTAAQEAELKLKTFNVDSANAKAAFDLENLKAKASNNMYLILGIVLVLVVGLTMYFKFRKK